MVASGFCLLEEGGALSMRGSGWAFEATIWSVYLLPVILGKLKQIYDGTFSTGLSNGLSARGQFAHAMLRRMSTSCACASTVLACEQQHLGNNGLYLKLIRVADFN